MNSFPWITYIIAWIIIGGVTQTFIHFVRKAKFDALAYTLSCFMGPLLTILWAYIAITEWFHNNRKKRR